jgi:hypothetical protein
MTENELNTQRLFGLEGKFALVTGGSRVGAFTPGAVISVNGGTSVNHQHTRTPWPEQSV